jgi:DNA-binding CsgD family transcriptional regulator
LPSQYYATSLTPLFVAAMVVDLRWTLGIAVLLAAGHLLGVVVINGHSFAQLKAEAELDDFIEQLGAYFVLGVLVAVPIERLGGYVLRVNRLFGTGADPNVSGDGEPAKKERQPRITDVLSVREIEVTSLVADGLSNDDIATQLYLSPRTVQTHIANAMRKTDTTSRTQLAVAAVRDGLVPPTHS